MSEEFAVSQGISIPRLGLGTFRMPGNECQQAVESALSVGYRHIDTAEMYENEASVGLAISASGVARKNLFVTTKVWHEHLAPDAIQRALDTSLAKLRSDYVDMYMVHWPSKDMDLPRVMETLMRLKDEGLTRAIGVCNFNLLMLRRVIEDIGAPIACVQVEYHPFLDQSRLLDYLKEKNIPLVAYAPLAQGRSVEDEVLMAIGLKYGVSAAQISIAWLLDQRNVIAIPKARYVESQIANLSAANIDLDEDDRRAIATLPKNQRYVTPPFSPVWDE
jgi:2,5-diketo-D-gluconate reductase B